ncbi:hypothetical protein [Lentibacillus saliphilus]|nr:hypothetical protein [Lentibacillus saliphilus]
MLDNRKMKYLVVILALLLVSSIVTSVINKYKEEKSKPMIMRVN